MKQRLLKLSSVTIIFLLMISIVGCSSSSSQKEDAVQNAKSTNITKEKKEQTATRTVNKQVQAAKSSTQSTKTNDSANSSARTEPKPATNQTASVAKNATTASKPTATKTTGTAVNNQTAAKTSPSQTENQKLVQTVKITIIGPKDKGTLLNGKSVNIQAGETVLDVLLAAAGKNNVDYSGSGASAYVRGIDNIYEFDYGAKSGWTFSQNGTFASKSAGAVTVHAGDSIKWTYQEN